MDAVRTISSSIPTILDGIPGWWVWFEDDGALFVPAGRCDVPPVPAEIACLDDGGWRGIVVEGRIYRTPQDVAEGYPFCRPRS